LPAARAFRREMQSRFGRLLSWGMVVRNIPPALVLRWRKESKSAPVPQGNVPEGTVAHR